jgi:hypothetical protein
VETIKVPLLTPIIRWFLFAMVLANIAGQMSPLLMPIYLTELGASVGQVGIVFTISSIAKLILHLSQRIECSVIVIYKLRGGCA